MRMVHKHFSANGSALRIALCSLLFVLCTLCDVQSATPFSQYGQIQNVPNYSSNPFWDPSGPYNQRMPTPVYVDGPEMNAGDCLRTVSALVANVCATVNNCAGMRLSDIRPTLMLQLSQLPGHTYATSCAGYIDTEFEKYVKKYGHAGVTSGTVSFPTTTTPQTAFPTPTISVRNPYSPQTPEWEREYNERAAALAQLQEQTATHGEELSHTDFPATFADLDFDERMDVLATGYDPYQGKSAYHPIKIQSYEDYLEEVKKYAKYTISYSCGTGTGTPPNATVVTNGESFVVSPRGECLCPGDDTFGGWAYDGKTYHPDTSVQWTFGTDATFVQKCDPKQGNPEQKRGGNNTTCKITYKCGNGSGTAPNGTTVQKDANYTLAQNTCTAPDGKTFAGWNDGATTRNAGTDMTCSGTDITYTAQYRDSNYMDANPPPTAGKAV